MSVLITITEGWINGVKVVISPYVNERPNHEKPTLLVIHNISLPPGKFGGPYIEQLFTGKLDVCQHPYFATINHLTVSAHCLIRRDGELVQFVSFDKRAWHAGQSVFNGRSVCNDFSIGIELEGSDFKPFTQEQYNVLVTLTEQLLLSYPITAIVGHSDIAPGRKTDPGPYFNWNLYQQYVKPSLIFHR